MFYGILCEISRMVSPEILARTAPWPNGQGIGPRSRGLQVRVLPGSTLPTTLRLMIPTLVWTREECEVPSPKAGPALWAGPR